MILAEFSKYLALHREEISACKTTPLKLLGEWICSVVSKNPKNNAEKSVHTEILYCANGEGDYLIVGKSDSGRVLVSALIKYAKSYENYINANRVEMIKKLYHQTDIT